MGRPCQGGGSHSGSPPFSRRKGLDEVPQLAFVRAGEFANLAAVLIKLKSRHAAYIAGGGSVFVGIDVDLV